jgi:hypothetical protein
MRGFLGGLALAAVAVASCAAPSRQLTPRVVEDPIVLPRRMASVSLGVRYAHYEPTDGGGTTSQGGFRVGLTNRLELTDLVGLRFAILDDRPADGRTPMPVSLAVGAGVAGIGYSSLEGMIVQPVARITALKHVADRWALSLSAGWVAQWVQDPITVVPAFGPGLGYSGRNRSTLTLGATVTRQLVERTALAIEPAVHQTNDCVDPTCGWVSRAASVSLLVYQRPWQWLTVSAGPIGGVRHRPDAVLPTMFPNGTPIEIPPRTVIWWGVSGMAAFYW